MTLAARRARIYLRRPPRPRWWQPAIFAASLVLGTSVLGGLGFWLGSSGAAAHAGAAIVHQALRLTGQMGFAVRDVYAAGRVRTDKDALRVRLGVEVGQPILALDPAAAKARLEQLPWVAHASVERLLPDRVDVRLIERQPLALWQREGRFDLVDGEGTVIAQDAREHVPGAVDPGYSELRVLVGEQAPRHAAHLFRMLSTEPALSARVAAATWVGDRRWTLRLDNRVDVLLPERNVLRAWRFLAAKVREERLLERAVSVIDLRFLPTRLRLRLDPLALQETKA
jgi:cell division protein FtsQ